ncbi:hypothetical protein PV779_57050 [Streptomyces sp. ID01-9D]|nr:hypothetical protein [Streptomyces sp. ID01-9D]
MTHTWKLFSKIGGIVVGFIVLILGIYGFRYQGIFKTNEFVIAATSAIVATLVCIAIFSIATLITYLRSRSN